ncbi:hypothetical protein BAE44_0020127 [Dichanthelium oligosanthes]|uniref:Uncharacterized protein n=1 Tax=Dichanthelium oligosanthes TaxID=888268 RepID=A0A1E5V1H1_9POAL|nr:hypothetical protein BAE44_0020127 [Dichanthelium oligosanthes]
MAAPPMANRDGGDASVSLFLHTDLGTRLALLAAPDTTIRGLKSLVDAEHAAAFPDLGPVAVKSFQVLFRGSEVRRKGELYHLSDSMTVTSAFTKIKGGCFLHVKMTEAAAATLCCQDDGRRSSDGRLGIHVEKRVQDLPAMTSENACHVLRQRLEDWFKGVSYLVELKFHRHAMQMSYCNGIISSFEGGYAAAAALNDVQALDALPSSSQLNTEIKKNEGVGLTSDTEAGCDPVIEKAKSYIGQIKHANQTKGAYISSTSITNVIKPSNQSNMPHAVEEVHARKENILHGHDVGGGVSDDKQVRIQEQMLEEIHAMDNLSQEKEHKKSRTDSFDTSAADPPRITNESDARDLTKSSRAPLEAGTTSHREPLNSSVGQEIQDSLHEESTENPSTVGKKKRTRRHLAPSRAAAQETNEPSAGAELSKSTGDAYNVELTGRDETAVKGSGLPLSSSGLNDGNQGSKHVQLMSDSQASTDLISEQGKFDHALRGCRNPSIGGVIYSAGEVAASEEKISKASITHWDGGEKHEQIKQHVEGRHDEGVAEISNMEKDGKSTDALEKQTNDNTSQLKKRKKAKKSSSVDLASANTTHEMEMHGYRENAARSDTVSTEREIVHDPSMQQISNNVHQGDSNMIENPDGDGKKKKRRRRHSESSKGIDPSQGLTKSSEFVTNESSMHFTDGAPLDVKHTTPGSIEATVSDHKKLGENPDIAAKTAIDEVLADLRSKDNLSKGLDGDMLSGQTHLGSNKNALKLPESTVDKVGVSAALPPKFPAGVHSDAPRLKKSKGEKLKVLSTTIDSSHHSSGVPEEDSSRELNESDSLRFSDKTSDPKDILTGDALAQADDKPKATKRRRKKASLKEVPADDGKTLDEQVSQVDTLDLKGVNATQANLVQGGSVVDTPFSTVGKVEQKGRSSSKTRTAKIQLDGQLAKDIQDEYVTNLIGTRNNENAAGTPTEMPVVQKDEALKSASPNAQKARKKSSNLELQSWDSALEHGSSADLGNPRSEKGLVSPKNSACAAEPNYDSVVHPASDAINFLDHFSYSNMTDPSVSTEHEQNNGEETLRQVKNKKKNKRKQGTGSIGPHDVLESLHPTDKNSLTGDFGTSKAIVPFVAAENMNKEDENVKNGKEKKKKRKVNTEMPVAEKENPKSDNQGYIGIQEPFLSVVQKGRMGQDNGKENSSKVTQNDSIAPYKPEDATKLYQSGVDGQNKLLTDKDHVDISKDMRKSTSQIKPLAKSKHDESVKGRVGPNPKPVSNLVKDFSMSPQVSSDSTQGMPQNANRYRVAVRKVPRKMYEQTHEKSKKGNRKVGSGAIFNDANSEGSDDELDTKNDKVCMEASPDNSSTSADSAESLSFHLFRSQKSLKDGLHIGSILRGSSSYKKARKKQSELLDDDTEVPDSQPADGLWD